MKEVKRFKCGYCNKLTAKTETMKRHEKQCLKNPNCFNCYMCEHAYADEYENYYSDDYSSNYKDVPHCAYQEEVLQLCFGGSGNIAETCDKYRRSNESCFCRDYDKAYSNLKKNGCDTE